MDKEEGILLVPNLAWGGIGAAGETGEDWGTSPSEINLPVAGEGRRGVVFVPKPSGWN